MAIDMDDFATTAQQDKKFIDDDAPLAAVIADTPADALTDLEAMDATDFREITERAIVALAHLIRLQG